MDQLQDTGFVPEFQGCNESTSPFGPPLPPPLPSLGEIERSLVIFLYEGMIAELRGLRFRETGRNFPMTVSGYFDLAHRAEMAQLAANASLQCEGVYVTLNPIPPDLLARRANRAGVISKDERTTSDGEIARRRYLLIDVDPCRPAGMSSTDDEKRIAWRVIEEIRSYLSGLGWPDPIIADSGNGFHLLYRIDLPAEDDGIIKAILESLAARFDVGGAKVDRTVFNPSRIIKLYGTVARKGDHTAERPHRLSRLLNVPDDLKIVPRELLEALAAEAPKDEKSSPLTDAAPPAPTTDRASIRSRASSYLAKLPRAISGQNGHGQTIEAAVKLRDGFGLDRGELLDLMGEYNARCVPPWSDAELAHKVDDAIARHPNPSLRLLQQDRPTRQSDEEIPLTDLVTAAEKT